MSLYYKHMGKNDIKILLIEDNPGDARILREMLEEAGDREFSFSHSPTFKEGLKQLGGHAFDVILLDIGLPDSSGLESISGIKQLAPYTPIVMLTGLDDENTAVSTLQMGAEDYLVKGRLDSSLLFRSLRYAIERKQVEEALRKAKDELEDRVRQRTAQLLLANEMINASNSVLKLFPQAYSINEYLDAVVALVQKWSGCKCTGVRLLRSTGEIPYESHSGFSKKFIDSENCLSIKSAGCICPRVMTENPDPQDVPFISPDGSFFCNKFSEFINSLSDEEKKRYHGVCMEHGYKSIAVIPIRHKSSVVGVFHLANERENKFPFKCIEFVEMIAPLVGEAIHKFNIEGDRARLMAAAESTLDAIIITDTSGRIQYANPASEVVTGHSREEIYGSDLHFLDSGNIDGSLYEDIRGRIRSGLMWNGRLVSKKKDGTLYQEECSIAPVRDGTGKISNYISVRRDVTEKLRLESIAEAVNTMNNIGYVFSGIRHEIGNPINSIKMTLNLIRLNLDTYPKQTVREYLERVLEELSRVEYLLQCLRNFNMYEKPEMKNIKVREFLENFLALSKNDYERKGIAITSSVGPDVDCCYADPRALQQVVLNIFTNAVDACEGMANPGISISASRSMGMIRLLIADNGRGMGEDQMRNAFKPFYTTKPAGTGLGLVIAKKMLAKMGSTIELRSRLNEGTDVELSIPEGTSEKTR